MHNLFNTKKSLAMVNKHTQIDKNAKYTWQMEKRNKSKAKERKEKKRKEKKRNVKKRKETNTHFGLQY
jgi:hypothetical protein